MSCTNYNSISGVSCLPILLDGDIWVPENRWPFEK
jgi:hypothetical protein